VIPGARQPCRLLNVSFRIGLATCRGDGPQSCGLQAYWCATALLNVLPVGPSCPAKCAESVQLGAASLCVRDVLRR
jgi:hypothetical protein